MARRKIQFLRQPGDGQGVASAILEDRQRKNWGKKLGETVGDYVASAGTPSLEWQLGMKIQNTKNISMKQSVHYSTSSLITLDEAAKTFPGILIPPTGGGLVHGSITVSRFPSMVLYLTVDTGTGPHAMPLYCSNAMSRNMGQIVLWDTDPLRQIPW